MTSVCMWCMTSDSSQSRDSAQGQLCPQSMAFTATAHTRTPPPPLVANSHPWHHPGRRPLGRGDRLCLWRWLPDTSCSWARSAALLGCGPGILSRCRRCWLLGRRYRRCLELHRAGRATRHSVGRGLGVRDPGGRHPPAAQGLAGWLPIVPPHLHLDPAAHHDGLVSKAVPTSLLSPAAVAGRGQRLTMRSWSGTTGGSG